MMKLGDGSRCKMHSTPECSERAELATECSSLLADWLALKDAITMTTKGDPRKALAVLRELLGGSQENADTERLVMLRLTRQIIYVRS
jgi:hypothetical protein